MISLRPAWQEGGRATPWSGKLASQVCGPTATFPFGVFQVCGDRSVGGAVLWTESWGPAAGLLHPESHLQGCWARGAADFSQVSSVPLHPTGRGLH